MTDLKALRMQKHLSQKEVSNKLGVSLRSYISYENDKSKCDSIKYKYLLNELEKINYIDEEHGILTLEEIKETCTRVFSNYLVDYCYLFGSYAKGKASESSDVDLLISTEVTGIRFFGLIEELRVALKKRVDLLNLDQLTNNKDLLNEILKDGIRIYG